VSEAKVSGQFVFTAKW